MHTNNIKLALVQADLLWQNTKGNLAKFDNLLFGISDDTDIVILPEMFATAFTMQVDKLEKPVGRLALDWLISKAKNLNKVLLGSLLFEEKNKYYNRMFWVNSDGSFHFYDKRHLFRMGNEEEVMTAGKDRVIVPFRGTNFMLQVCYDLRFPVFVKNNFDSKTKTHDYDVIVYIANWPEIRKKAYNRLLKARAIENQAYVVWVNRVGKDDSGIVHSGDSQLIDPLGNILNQLSAHQENILYANLDLDKLQEIRKSFEVGLDWDNFNVRP